MKLEKSRIWSERIEITRPYAIAYKSSDTAKLGFVALLAENGNIGFGSASPDADVTGETFDGSMEAMHAAVTECHGKSAAEALKIIDSMGPLQNSPAARAALDMALWDLIAQERDKPLVDVWGRHHDALPTSITIGIKSMDETLDEAKEYAERGFRIIKLKLGHDQQENIARTLEVGAFATQNKMGLRVDFNQACDLSEFATFVQKTSHLNIDLMEQPFRAGDLEAYKSVPHQYVDRVALDESVVNEADADRVIAESIGAGIINIKLMKCGGPSAARRIAAKMAEVGKTIMWGCMDESVISIAAGLHSAFSCPNTRYLDLDGSLDLAWDLASGGFEIEDGIMRTTDRKGLGIVSDFEF